MNSWLVVYDSEDTEIHWAETMEVLIYNLSKLESIHSIIKLGKIEDS